jgi:hypothetical protein
MHAIRIALVAAACICGALPTGAASSGGRVQERIDEALRREGDAIVRLAEDAIAGRRVPNDLTLAWSHDFFKARPGTFVPFTISFSAPDQSSRRALLYVRVVDRSMEGRAKGGAPAYETIFPVRIDPGASSTVYVTRGFAVPPGRYRVVVALRESSDGLAGRASGLARKAGVLLQDLDVPDFWTGQLATSTVMLADRVEQLNTPVPADELDEDPYVVGSSRIHVSRTRAFGRDRELIVAFLIYNLSVGPDGHFDLQVDYHLYRKDQGGQAPPDTPAGHPPARPGERYVTRTNPQRFNPSMMGAQFDPAAGTPVLAGQGILLSGFEPGDYRLGITVTDLLSRKTLSRDVAFTVGGSELELALGPGTCQNGA